MAHPLVMTIISPDRTGIVESIARVVAENGGNWLESRMCRLGGEFAGILRIEIAAEKKPTLLDALAKVSGEACKSSSVTIKSALRQRVEQGGFFLRRDFDAQNTGEFAAETATCDFRASCRRFQPRRAR